MKLRELLTEISPVTLGLILIHASLLGVRLASARPTRAAWTPTGEEREVVAPPGRTLRDLQQLTPERGLAIYHGKPSGAFLLDWSRISELEKSASLAGLELFGGAAARRADHRMLIDDRLVTVTGTRNYAWRFTWDEATEEVVRQHLPPRFLWLDPSGQPVTEDSVQKPDDWPNLYPPSVMTSAHLAIARPLLERPPPPEGRDDGIKRTRAGDRGIMVFDLRDGRPLTKLDTDPIREMFQVPNWPGFAWTDASSCWLRYVTCDEAGRCRLGTSDLRATEPILGASFRPDLDRLAVCSTRHVLFYEGRVDEDVRFLGRHPLSKPCRSLVLTSSQSAAVMLEDHRWVMTSMEPRP